MSRSFQHVRRRAHALTLIECLIASLLLALAASAVLVAMGAGLQHQRYAQEQRVATDLAEQLLEQVTARAYIDPADPNFGTLAPAAAQGMDGYTDTVDETGQAAAGATYARALDIGTAAEGGVSGIAGAGLAIVQITTPSGQVIRLKRILAVQ